MRDYGKIAATFWTRGSGKALRGDPQAQVLAVYLMTAPASSMTGLYHIGLPTVSHETGIPLEGASKALRRLSEGDVAHYDELDEVVWLPKMAFYQIGPTLADNDKRVKGVVAAIRPFAGHRFYSEFVRLYGDAYNLGIVAPCKPLASPLQAPCKPLRSQAQAQAHAQAHAQAQEQEQVEPASPDPSFSLTSPPAPDAGASGLHTKGPKKDRCLHVGPTTPEDGLDTVDRCRRGYAILWHRAERYNGTPYPDQPGADRKAVGELLGYHRRNKIAVPWREWIFKVCSTYLGIEDDLLVVKNCHPLSFMPRLLPRIVTTMKEES